MEKPTGFTPSADTCDSPTSYQVLGRHLLTNSMNENGQHLSITFLCQVLLYVLYVAATTESSTALCGRNSARGHRVQQGRAGFEPRPSSAHGCYELN